MDTSDLRLSRIDGVARQLGSMAADAHRFADKTALLSADPEAMATAQGQLLLTYGLRLIVRMCRNVRVCVPNAPSLFLHQLRTLASEIEFLRQVRFVSAPGSYDARFHVGTSPAETDYTTTVATNGWLAQVTSDRFGAKPQLLRFNPMSALAAACLGTSDVFKRLCGVSVDRGPLFQDLRFSLLDFGDTNTGPDLPEVLSIDALLFGAGAIGNGVITIVEQLPLRGRLDIVDSQKYQDGNLATCVMIGLADLNHSKALRAEARLDRLLAAKGFEIPIDEYLRIAGHTRPIPRMVLAGPDNIQARHQVQDLWPDIVIDGAIDSLTAAVGRHPWDSDTACLRCTYFEPVIDAETLQARVTGLGRIRLADPDSIVTETDVAVAPAAKREWLRERVGKKICSVVTEGVEGLQIGFQPSAPFVACLSAAMMVSEAVKYWAGWSSPIRDQLKIDLLLGPATSQMFRYARKPSCVCVARRKNIERARALHLVANLDLPSSSPSWATQLP